MIPPKEERHKIARRARNMLLEGYNLTLVERRLKTTGKTLRNYAEEFNIRLPEKKKPGQVLR